jgi:hypothetical protein
LRLGLLHKQVYIDAVSRTRRILHAVATTLIGRDSSLGCIEDYVDIRGCAYYTKRFILRL